MDILDNTKTQPQTETVSTREEDIHSIVSNKSSIKNPSSECTETQENHTYNTAHFGSTNDLKDHYHMHYNTLQQHKGATNTLPHEDFSSALHNLSRDKQLNAESNGHSSTGADVHEQYNFQDKCMQSEREHYTSRKQGDKVAYEITPLDYEIVCQTPNEDQKTKEISDDHKLFDNDIYSKTQSASVSGSQQEQMGKGCTTQPTPEQMYFEIEDKNSLCLLQDINNEHEYAEPQVVNRVQRNTQGQNTQCVGGHYYHSLEGSDKGVEAASSACINGGGSNKELQTKHVKNAVLDHTYDSPDTFKNITNREVENTTHLKTPSLPSHQNQSFSELSTEENKYQTLTPPTTLSHSNQSLNEIGTATAPILFNIEHCQLDDPLYDGVIQHSDTLQESKDMNVDIFDDPKYA